MGRTDPKVRVHGILPRKMLKKAGLQNVGRQVFILGLRPPLVCRLLVFVLKPVRDEAPTRTEATRSEIGLGFPELHDFVEACPRALSTPRAIDHSPSCADTALCEQAKRRLSLCTPGGLLCSHLEQRLAAIGWVWPSP